MHYDTKVKHSAVQPGVRVLLQPVVDPGGGGGSGGSLESPSAPLPVLKFSMKMKKNVLNETKLFHFHGICKKK